MPCRGHTGGRASPPGRLADGALGEVRVDVEPLVEARPAEEMAAERDHGVLGQLKADVALEAARVHAAIDACRGLVDAVRHGAPSWIPICKMRGTH